MRLRYHPSALAELRAAVVLSERERPGRGTALAAAVAKLERRVRKMPKAEPIWRGLDSPLPVRKAKVRRTPYLLLYAEFERELVVLAVAHSRQAPGYWQKRLEELERT